MNLNHSFPQQIFTERILYCVPDLEHLSTVPSQWSVSWSVKWSFVKHLYFTEVYKQDEYENNVQNVKCYKNAILYITITTPVSFLLSGNGQEVTTPQSQLTKTAV